MALISIIIPVYNTSMYLKQCVDSVINQDFAQYEIILVDDGSTDSSGTICDEYSLNHDFIKVIHKENGGLSDARNTGLANALGEHILFIDSDDYISENSLSSLYDTMNEESDVDVIFLDAVKAFSDGTALPLGDNYIKDKILYKTHKEVLDHLASLPKFPGSACTKLIRRKLIAENNLYFVKNQLNEDIDWTIRLFLAAETFNYCPGYCYFYRQKRQGSITNKSSLKSLE
jgi:glycosyltransferase involved in cell wall biosynthesis